MSRKVLHILGSLLTGGAELSLLRILSNWTDDGFSFSVLYTREFDDLKRDFDDIGIKTVSLGWNNERDFKKIPGLIKLFRKEKPHIVHTHLWTGNYWVAAAARLSSVPIIVETVHDVFHHTRMGLFLHRIMRPPYSRSIKASVCVSHSVKNYLERYYKQSSNSTTVIYNGIEKPVKKTNATKNNIKSEIGLTQDTPVLLTIANLIPVKKGYEVYLDSLRILSKKGKDNFHALIVGDVRNEYPGFLDHLQSKVKEFEIENKVTFLGYRSDVHEILSSSDIFVMPSIYEGGPIVVLEAMRAGIPVVATRTGAVPEYIDDSESGLIVEPGNSKALASAIERILQKPETWTSMGRKGMEQFENYYTIDKTVDSLTELYYSLLSQKLPTEE